MSFEAFIDRAWSDHAADPAGVAARLADGEVLVRDEAQLASLIGLAHHLHGEHLGEWSAGIACIDRLAALPQFTADGPSGAARARHIASLKLSAGAGAELNKLSLSDRIRVGAMAAANLAARDAPRAGRLLQDALDLARTTTLPTSDPTNRALAVTGNNLACALEEKQPRSADERALMILAAQTARRYWAIAGTWLEVERAEYRLANTWLQAGDPTEAGTHAQACLDLVIANDGPAIERLFAWQALGLVGRAAGDRVGQDRALQQARAALAQVDPADRAWCAAEIDKLGG